MDHHCPWVGSCIGVKNQKQFILFNFYTMLVCVTAVLILLFRGMGCLLTNKPQEVCQIANSLDRDMFIGGQLKRLELVALVVVFISGIFFAVFTLSMLSEQLYMVAHGTSTIDRKNDRTQQRQKLARKIPLPDSATYGFYQRFSDVMGFPLLWLFPIKYMGGVSPENELNQFYL